MEPGERLKPAEELRGARRQNHPEQGFVLCLIWQTLVLIISLRFFFVSGSSGWPFYSKSYASSTNFSVCHCHLIVEVADSTSSFSLETNHELCKLCIQPKLNVAYKPIKIMFPPQLKLRSFSLFERRTLHTKYCTCMLMTVTREAIDISSTEPTSYMHRSLTCNGHVPYMQ